MITHLRVLFALVLGFVCSECAVLSGKALFCRDPDSGKLHAVNTSWASVSFCGNYTCKLRKRNNTQTVYTPLRQLNITNVRKDGKTDTLKVRNEPSGVLNTQESKSKYIDSMINVEKHLNDLENRVESSYKNDKLNEFNKNTRSYADMKRNNEAKPQTTTPAHFLQNYRITQTSKINDDKETVENPDRYLTENEIKSITEILHTVKKSDLEAIVDIYNLAQNIYQEIDKTESIDLIDDTLNEMKEERKLSKATSYWYDSIVNKGKSVDLFDMEVQNSKNVLTTASVKDEPHFNGALSNKEQAKQPFYYPISNFQRLASYTHVPNYSNYESKTTNRVKVDTKKNTGESKKKHHEKEIQPSHLLPYPFAYVNQYNITDLPSFYYNNPSWRVDYYNRYRYYQPYYNAFIAQVPSALIYNNNEIQDIEPIPMNKHELDRLQRKEPSWKTGPIPREDIEEMRANVDTSKVMALPLRKLVKLERVGKVNKVTDSEELLRTKRSSYKYKMNVEEEVNGNDGDYETYLEKVTLKP